MGFAGWGLGWINWGQSCSVEKLNSHEDGQVVSDRLTGDRARFIGFVSRMAGRFWDRFAWGGTLDAGSWLHNVAPRWGLGPADYFTLSGLDT
jgi:hypothetical protein